jgi:hypothetical protein
MTREDAIKEIQDASDYEVRHGDIEHHHEEIMRRVEAFEKAVNALQKYKEWIPVSEKLPKPGETEGNVTKYYLVQGEYGDRFVACYHKDGWQQIFHYDCEIEEEVVAWMELPEPYGEGECKNE